MIYRSILLMLLLSAHVLAVEGDPVDETLQTEDGVYHVRIDKDEKTIDVVRNDSKSAAPAEVRMLIHRKNKKPLEVRLHAIEKPDQPLRYTGRIDPWNGSMIGFELEFSFDRKTWKRIFEKVMPSFK